MRKNRLSYMIGGAAGLGVRTAGPLFAHVCARAGLHVFGNLEYASNIRGEHQSFQVMAYGRNILGHKSRLDILQALDGETIARHKGEVRPGGAIIFDSEAVKLKPEGIGRDDVLIIDLPFLKTAKELKGRPEMQNVLGLGAVQGLLSFDFDLLAETIRQSLSRLRSEVIEANITGARRFYEQVKKDYSSRFEIVLKKVKAPDRMLVDGNQALAMGAIKAGLKFYAGYPMTPSSSLMTYLASHETDFDLVVKHAEDEIAAIGMAVGAAFAGARAMAGTSGGGFALMSEFYGFAAMAEIPLVIAECQRPGPSTGLPTRTEQGDLKFVLSASQGEFPRIVIAPGDPEESFRIGFEAFNLADRYQTPVIVLMDKHLSESVRTCEPFDMSSMKIDRGELLDATALKKIKEYRRHRITDSGISPRSRPGIPGGVFTTTGDEHDEAGHIDEEEAIRTAMVEKRLRKISTLDVTESGAKLHGEPDADLTVVGWGSTKGAILEAMALLKEKGVGCNFLQVLYMNPFPAEKVSAVLEAADRVVLVENNATAQLADVIAEKTGHRIKETVLKYSGRQFLTDELADRLRSPV